MLIIAVRVVVAARVALRALLRFGRVEADDLQLVFQVAVGVRILCSDRLAEIFGKHNGLGLRGLDVVDEPVDDGAVLLRRRKILGVELDDVGRRFGVEAAVVHGEHLLWVALNVRERHCLHYFGCPHRRVQLGRLRDAVVQKRRDGDAGISDDVPERHHFDGDHGTHRMFREPCGGVVVVPKHVDYVGRHGVRRRFDTAGEACVADVLHDAVQDLPFGGKGDLGAAAHGENRVLVLQLAVGHVEQRDGPRFDEALLGAAAFELRREPFEEACFQIVLKQFRHIQTHFMGQHRAHKHVLRRQRHVFD